MTNMDILIKTSDGIYHVDSVYISSAMFSQSRICLYGICNSHESFEICVFKEGNGLTAEEAAKKILDVIWKKIEAVQTGVVLVDIPKILRDAYD